MEKLISVLQIVTPVVLMLLIGIFARRKKLLSDAGAADIKTVLLNFCIPAVLFNTFYSTDFTWTAALLCAVMAVITVAAWLLGFAAQKLLHIDQFMTPYLCTSLEGGMMGFALFILLFGQDSLYHLALLDLGHMLVLSPFLLTKLRLRSQSDISPRTILKNMASPINISILCGLLVSISGLGRLLRNTAFALVLNDTLSFVSGPTGAMILLIVGYGLDFSSVRWDETLKTIFARMVIFAVFGTAVYLLVSRLFPTDPIYGYGAIMAFILPPTFMYSMFAKGEREESYVGSVLAVYTLVSLIGYGALVWLAA